MKIKKIINQYRRDFYAIYECEHCGDIEEKSGYDDRNFHENIIPAMKCKSCRRTSDNTYRPLTTKYQDSEII